LKMRRLIGLRSRLRRWRTAVIGLAVLGLFTSAANAVPPDDLDQMLRALSMRPWWGNPPPLTLLGVDGRRHSLDQLRGQVVLLYFWATWCPICTGELPSEVESLHREFKDQGLVIWAVSIREAPDHVTAWLKHHPVSSPVLLDLDGAATGAFRVTGTPSFVLVDRAGHLVGRGVGPRNWSGERGRVLLRALLSGG